MTNDIWVLEWDCESNQIHVQPAHSMATRNLVKFRENEKPVMRWVTILIGTYEQVSAMADRIRPTVIDREKAA